MYLLQLHQFSDFGGLGCVFFQLNAVVIHHSLQAVHSHLDDAQVFHEGSQDWARGLAASEQNAAACCLSNFSVADVQAVLKHIHLQQGYLDTNFRPTVEVGNMIFDKFFVFTEQKQEAKVGCFAQALHAFL